MPAVRQLAEADLSEAQRIMRTAFGTFLGAPDPDTFWTDFDYIYGRHAAPHIRSFAVDDADGGQPIPRSGAALASTCRDRPMAGFRRRWHMILLTPDRSVP